MIMQVPMQAMTPKYVQGKLNAGETKTASRNSNTNPLFIKCNVTFHSDSPLRNLLIVEMASTVPARKMNVGAQ